MYLLRLLSSIFLVLQERKQLCYKICTQDRLVDSYTVELEKYIQLGSEISTNYYMKVTQSPIYCQLLLLAFIASSALVIYAHSNTSVLMEISKQGHVRVKQSLCTF